MAQSRRHGSFALKAHEGFAVPCLGPAQNFDRHALAQAEVVGFVDGPHAALSNPTDQLIGAAQHHAHERIRLSVHAAAFATRACRANCGASISRTEA